MQGQQAGVKAGEVKVVTTQNKGLSVEYWAERCLERLVYVAEESDSIIKEQALAFKTALRKALLFYMEKAILSNRTTIYNVLIKHGETKAAEIIRRL
jgi:hypothetical protein